MEKKAIFITGGSSGIGAASVRKFVAEGWNVAFADIDDVAGEALAAETGALYAHADTRNAAEVQAAVDVAKEAFGGLTAVFCNAGIHRRNTMLDTPEEEFDLVVKTNLYGTFHTLKATVPAIIASGGGAVVINASDQSMVGKRASFTYGLTKGALGQIARSLSLDLLPKGVRVNAVCPGTIHTALVDRLFNEVSERTGESIDSLWQAENSDYTRGYAGTPEEVAEMVYFLASDKSSFCSGGLYLIDGGLSAG